MKYQLWVLTPKYMYVIGKFGTPSDARIAGLALSNTDFKNTPVSLVRHDSEHSYAICETFLDGKEVLA